MQGILDALYTFSRTFERHHMQNGVRLALRQPEATHSLT